MSGVLPLLTASVEEDETRGSAEVLTDDDARGECLGYAHVCRMYRFDHVDIYVANQSSSVTATTRLTLIVPAVAHRSS